MSEEKKREVGENPLFVELMDKIVKLEIRVAKLEEKTSFLEKTIMDLRERIGSLHGWIEKIDNRVFTILVGVVISILLQILFRLWH